MLRRRIAMTAAAFVVCLAVPTAAQTDKTPSNWPKALESDRGTIIIYQPQVETYKDNILEARAAVSVTAAGQSETQFGACWFKAWLATDLDTRIAVLDDVEVTAAKFPTLEPSQVNALTDYLETEIPQWDLEIDIDLLVASLDPTQNQEHLSEQLNNDPPEIIFATDPAVLVLVDGDPIVTDMEGYDMKYVANTAFFISQDPKSKRYYLKGGDYWYSATDLTGDWTTTTDLPSELQKVAAEIDEEERQQDAQVETDTTETDDTGGGGAPRIIVRTKPAELVLSDGDLKFVPIDGTQLLYVENTDTDILMDLRSQSYYILLSGRWYTSGSMTGNDWSFVSPDKVPADFAKIPAESEMGQVRASVPGTQESKDAILETQIPQTAEIDRNTATVQVSYDGDPKFEACTDKVAYALNTDKSVLLIDGKYYCCDQAVWFVGTGPTGPWQVATEVPAEVQDLPPECPVYNVKYVYIYDSTPEIVYIGYTPGYTNCYVYYGTVVYGTGYWYRPWYHHYYYPRPVTWGFHVHYNSMTGWGFSWGVSTGWLHIRVGRPWYGGWWGPAGYRHGYYHGYNRGYYRGAQAGYRAGYRAGQSAPNANLYKSRNTGVRTTGSTASPKTQQARQAAPNTRKTPKTTNQKDNVYADKNGNVHRNQGGNWQQKDKSGWSNSKGSNQNLNRDYQSRQRSQQKSAQRRQSGRPARGGGRR
jgi:hypothetical protein